MKRLLLTAAVVACSLATAVGAETDRQAEEEGAIRKAVESYVAAFNRADAKRPGGILVARSRLHESAQRRASRRP